MEMTGNEVLKFRQNHFILKVKVLPKSGLNQWGEVLGNERIQLRITAPPVDGAANKACVRFISKEFGTARSNVRIAQGEKSKLKTFLIEAANEEKVENFIRKYIVK